MSIFDERKSFKPFEYPEAISLMESLNHTYWLHSELTFASDKSEFNQLPTKDQEIIKRSLLLISTIEVNVKTFWTQLGNHFPKPEWSMLGVAAGESEARHAMSYSHLLTLLGLEDEFEECLSIPAIKGRYEYLEKYLKLSPSNSDKKKYITKLILFSVLIENVSLFSQFCTIMYYYRNRGIMKDIRNIIKWTSVDESLHFNIGASIIDILRKEHPELFDEELNDIIKKACLKSVKYESNLLDWVFEGGELEDLTKVDLLSYMKSKVNDSMDRMGFEKPFNEFLDTSASDFFFEEVFADSMDDFFASRPTDYTLNDVSISGDDLF